MAYSDYGGYAYREGVRVEERSDYTIKPDGTGFGTPGSYPGFALIASGVSPEEVQQVVSYPHHHVVLGDGPILIGLHKQLQTLLYRDGERLDPIEYLDTSCLDAVTSWEHNGESGKYIDHDWPLDTGKPLMFNVEGTKIEVHYVNTDNYYQLVKVTKGDVVWTGFSGYGVGAGLEDCDYGFSTDQIEALLFEKFGIK